MRKNQLFLSSLFIVLISCLLLTNSLYAASVKSRMAARIPEINSLKDQGKIGENNLGYIQYKSSEKPNQSLVNGENKDRKLVYRAIAKKQGVDPILVGQRRAKMIAKKGKVGHWFQDSNDSWYQK